MSDDTQLISECDARAIAWATFANGVMSVRIGINMQKCMHVGSKLAACQASVTAIM